MNKHMKAAFYTLLATIVLAIFVALVIVTKGLFSLVLVPVAIYFIVLDSL